MLAIIQNYSGMLWAALGKTLLLTLLSLLFAMVIGMIFALMNVSKSRVLNCIGTVYVDAVRGVPLIVLAYFIYFGIPAGAQMLGFSNFRFSALQGGTIALAMNCGAYMAEILRGGIISIDKGQFEGAYSIGMNHFQAMMSVVVPQTMRNILPAISNEFVINIKDTSVLNVIGVTELYFFTAKISKMTWAIFETYVVACVIYFILTFTITRILKYIERRIDGPSSYVIHHSSTMPDESFTVKEASGNE